MRQNVYHKQSNDEDQLLWSRLISGDKDALGQLFDNYIKELLVYGYRISKNSELTKDTIQDVFVDLWVYRENLAREVQVKFYLLRCLRNSLRKQMGSTLLPTIELSDDDVFSDLEATPEKEWMAHEANTERDQHLIGMLMLLSDREREIVSLKYYSSLKIKEIATLLSLREQTIANTLQNALVKLRKHLVYHVIVLFGLFL